MSYKFVIPYFLTAASLLMPGASRANENDVSTNNDGKSKIENKAVESDMTAQNDSTAAINLLPQLTGIETMGKSVIYAYNDGTKIKRGTDGTRAWRNNNPGNLRYYQFAKEHGTIGEAGGFAVFPDEQTGMAALVALLQTSTYAKLTILQAINRYADKSVVARYVRQLTKLTGLSANTKLGTLNRQQIEQIAKSIRKIEGWIEGAEQEIDSGLVAQNAAMMRLSQRDA